jgi:hypothetical protein
MPSNALKALTNRPRDVDQLMDAHTAVAGSTPGRKYDVEGLNRAAVLMLCSHFEGYLEDIMEEALKGVNPQLNAAALTGGFHNPWPDRIDELFSFLGMQKPSKSISWRKAGNSVVRKSLEKLVRTRNKLAHGTTGVKVKKSEVRSMRRYVEGFAREFDGHVRAQVHSLTGNYPWKA